jgi:GDPmannose 4,6-dehydratase
MGKQKCLFLGNLNAKRDWGHARDYVEGMYMMLQCNKPDDYVLATGTTTTIRDFVYKSFLELGIEIHFIGSDELEVGIIHSCNGDYKIEVGKTVVRIDPKYYRPTEVDLLIGDSTKALHSFGWKPKITLELLIREMIGEDLLNAKKEFGIRLQEL